MHRASLAAIAAFALLSPGCALNHKYRVAPWPWEDRPACAGTCTPPEALAAFNDANMFCRRMQDFYAAGGSYAQTGKMTISTLGAVAGSVVAPFASGSAATAWSGVSGVANGLQTQIDQAFSDAVDAQRRASIAEAANAGAEDFHAHGSDNTRRVMAAMDMARGCAMSAGFSDRKALRAVMADGDE